MPRLRSTSITGRAVVRVVARLGGRVVARLGGRVVARLGGRVVARLGGRVVARLGGRSAARILPALAIVGLTACGGDDSPVVGDAARFCAEATEQRDTILAPPMASEAELQASLEFYRLMGQLAPVAIAAEWGDLVHAMETASTVVPGDPESEQLAAMTAYAVEPSAYRVKDWLLDNCGLDLPITTIAPQEQAPARTTTIAPPPSSVPAED